MQGSSVDIKKSISPSVKENLRYIETTLEQSMDLVVREFRLGNGQAAVRPTPL